jgi:hypothetical protein
MNIDPEEGIFTETFNPSICTSRMSPEKYSHTAPLPNHQL